MPTADREGTCTTRSAGFVRLMRAGAVALSLVFIASGTVRAQTSMTAVQSTARPNEQTLSDAYIYLLSRLLVIRQEQMDSKASGFAYNAIKYNPLGSADFVNPNFDVAYLEAWLAVDDDSAVILEVPEVKGRYYTAEILDEWGEVIVNINERTFPSKSYGKFALVKPGSKVAIPADATRIELHSAKAKMLGRVELKDDPDGAIALQKQFKVAVIGTAHVETPPKIPEFDNKTLAGVEAFDNVDAVFASALDVSPTAAEMQQKVRAVATYVASSAQARMAIGDQLRDHVVPEFELYAFTKSAPYRNQWAGGAQTGNYGKDFRLRTTVNYAGIWANVTDEVIYFVATRDAEDKPLDGGKSYVIHFPADRLPSKAVNAYWSVILVGVPDYRVVPNQLNRFNVNSYSPLRNASDGSLDIAIGPQPVSGIPESNWLPSSPGKPFSLTFRTYVPKDAVKRGEWSPPAVKPAT
jgi:hypothetical protein